MATYTINMKKGDRLPLLVATLRQNGAPVNLTGGSVKFIMKSVGGGAAKVNAACALTTPASGIVTYSWAAADTDTPGLYHAEFQFNNGSGLLQSFPNNEHLKVLIADDIAD
jgi:hypothetical protein